MDGSRLRDVRKDNGDTQESRAKKLRVATATVSKWEQGVTEPNFDTLKEICRMYHVTSDYLLSLTNDDPFLAKQRRELLSEDSKKILRQFEEFLIQRDRKASSK